MRAQDKHGFDMRAVLPSGAARTVRLQFRRQVEKEQDALSQLTMLAQQLWETERPYQPQPVAKPAAAGSVAAE